MKLLASRSPLRFVTRTSEAFSVTTCRRSDSEKSKIEKPAFFAFNRWKKQVPSTPPSLRSGFAQDGKTSFTSSETGALVSNRDFFVKNFFSGTRYRWRDVSGPLQGQSDSGREIAGKVSF